jgi:POT family proton-dependent oligopeptide transporter
MLGVNYLNAFFGSVISGRLGGLYEQLSSTQFWLLHSAIVGGAGIFVLALANPLRRMLVAPLEEPAG